MKKISTIFGLLIGSIVLSQANFELAQQEKKAHQIENDHEISFLETDYVPEYYRLEFNSDPNFNAFSGKTTMHFTTTAATNIIEINAQQNLTITAVNFHDTPITTYSRNNDVLSITLPTTLPTNQLDSISIGFSGTSNSSNGYSIGTHNGTRISYTLSEPWHGSSWWVCKDDLLDKVDNIDIYITHPTSFKAASNGTLMSVTNVGGGMSRTHWKHNYPIPTYLVAIAVTNYVEYNSSVVVGGTTVPIINYVYPESLSGAQNNLNLTPTYISEISDRYGDYPYKLEKYGHAEWEWGGGMEHATMSFMGGWSKGLIKHELAHQWFGDRVTCGTWSDIWINEGFAEYTDGWLEDVLNGESAFTQWKGDYVGYITSWPTGSVYNPEPDNENRIFDYRLTYAKGSMMVHLIRYMINDDDLFFQSLQDFLENPLYSYGFATTEDLKASLVASTGMDWDEYFSDWIYGQGHPIFNVHVNGNPANLDVTVTINQGQSHSSVSFFETPFEILFRGTGGQTAMRKFYLTENGQQFLVTDLPFEVTNYTFNPKNDLVCEVNSQILNSSELTEESSSAQLYPNPASAVVFVENKTNIDEIKVFELSGKLIFNEKDFNSNKVQIATSSWVKGTYLVQIKSGDRTQLKKLLVK